MNQRLASAVEDFRRARLQAKLQSVVARLTGQSTELLSYEEVRRRLGGRELPTESLEDIPLDAIIGSVGRYKDFTRRFLPRQESSRDRWARVEVAMTGMTGVPPIEVYQIGDAYFVLDGNHRVSVARQLGATHLQAYVTKVATRVPLSPEVEPDDLIINAEYTGFLERTRIDEMRPKADLRVTVPGQYEVLEEHIEVHRYFMGLEQQRHVPYQEAASHWYDEVYLPVVGLIRQRGILRDFPQRTDTDLYLWLSEHRAALEDELGWQVSADRAAGDLVDQFSQKPVQVVRRVRRRVLNAITPDELEPGPPVGRWRKEYLEARQDDRLFAEILVAVDGQQSGWSALDQALILANREGARLQGLHVVTADGDERTEKAETLQAEFGSRCRAAGIQGRLVLAVGAVRREICDRARWADLVVLSLSHPPATGPIATLGSGLTTIIRRCPRPVLTVPRAPSTLQHALLAYDGTPKAREAMFVATYIAGRWGVPLTVVSVEEAERVGPETLDEAQAYLEIHGVEAHLMVVGLEKPDTVAESIVGVVEKQQCDLLLMGGYGVGPVAEVLLGSEVDRVLRESQWPALICR
jgi:nucleotide-binding universal stress UspA family protein